MLPTTEDGRRDRQEDETEMGREAICGQREERAVKAARAIIIILC